MPEFQKKILSEFRVNITHYPIVEMALVLRQPEMLVFMILIIDWIHKNIIEELYEFRFCYQMRTKINYGPKKSYDTISNINVLFNQIILNLVPLLKIHSIFV